MALPCLIIGKSGSGKTASLRNFNPDEVALINVQGKPLSFRGKFDSMVTTEDYTKIQELCLKTGRKVIVIDDAGYLITGQFMAQHATAPKGGNAYEMYNQMADNYWNLIQFIKGRLPNDKVVYLIMHEDTDTFGNIRPKTIGKLLDDKVCIEGLFSIVLRSTVEDGEYYFRTKGNGSDVTKTPMGMFDEDKIENDLKAVDKVIREYYEMGAEDE